MRNIKLGQVRQINYYVNTNRLHYASILACAQHYSTVGRQATWTVN